MDKKGILLNPPPTPSTLIITIQNYKTPEIFDKFPKKTHRIRYIKLRDVRHSSSFPLSGFHETDRISTSALYHHQQQ